MDKPLWGLRIQAPFGAVGIGTGTWAVLASIPVGTCACGAEGPMASIGPLALGAKGCVERLHCFAQGAADWRSGSRWRIISALCPVHPFPLRGTSPQGETRDMKRKTGESYASCTTPAFPPLVAGATTLPGGKRVTGFSVAYGSLRIQFPCHPRSSVGRQKESALMGRLGALVRPTWRSYAGPPQGTIKLRYAVSCL